MNVLIRVKRWLSGAKQPESGAFLCRVPYAADIARAFAGYVKNFDFPLAHAENRIGNFDMLPVTDAQIFHAPSGTMRHPVCLKH